MTTKPPSILVAEDEPKIANLLLDYLKKDGYETTWLDKGSLVVPIVKRQAPDLLLLDVGLPGKDGMTICREIRAFSNLPIIMLTAAGRRCGNWLLMSSASLRLLFHSSFFSPYFFQMRLCLLLPLAFLPMKARLP